MKRAVATGVTLLTSVLAGAGLILTVPGQAYASQDASVIYQEGGVTFGYGSFNSDPTNSIPGDAINACDSRADGWGIEVQLDINPGASFDVDRVATTSGHSAGYCSSWVPGDITEDAQVMLRICKIQGGTTVCGEEKVGSA